MAAQLPFQKTDNADLTGLQTQWKAILDPFTALPANNGILITDITLASGDNTINTTLGRTLQGWYVVRRSTAADIYDKQAANTTPNRTLVLNSSGACVISLVVF